jgi:PEP-CTERM motif
MRLRRWRAIAIIFGLAVALGGAGTLTIAGLDGGNVVHAAMNRAKSLADLLDQRSPGARTEGELTKTKHARALAKQRMAGGPKAHQPVAPPPRVNMPDIAQLLESPPPLAPVSLDQPLPLTAISSPPPLAAIIAPPPGGGGVVIPPGGGGGPVTFPTELPREPVIPPSAVPEPATWAMMLLGFGLIGWRVRAVYRRPFANGAPQG